MSGYDHGAYIRPKFRTTGSTSASAHPREWQGEYRLGHGLAKTVEAPETSGLISSLLDETLPGGYFWVNIEPEECLASAGTAAHLYSGTESFTRSSPSRQALRTQQPSTLSAERARNSEVSVLLTTRAGCRVCPVHSMHLPPVPERHVYTGAAAREALCWVHGKNLNVVRALALSLPPACTLTSSAHARLCSPFFFPSVTAQERPSLLAEEASAAACDPEATPK